MLLMLDEKNSALTLQVLWVGFKTEKVYFHRKAREIGESRWTLSKKIKLVVDSMMSFSYFPVRFMTGLGGVYAVGAVIWAVDSDGTAADRRGGRARLDIHDGVDAVFLRCDHGDAGNSGRIYLESL